MKLSGTLTIGEFSKLINVSQSTIRHYDKIGLLKPKERNSRNNYRMYAENQIGALAFITALTYAGLSLKEISKVLRNRTPKTVSDLFHKIDNGIISEIQALAKRASYIHAWNEVISHGIGADVDKFEVMKLDKKMVRVVQIKENDKEMLKKYGLYTYLSKSVNRYLPMGWLYDNIDTFKSEPESPTSFISIDPEGLTKREAGDYLVGYVRGSYGEFGDMAERMNQYLENHSLMCLGPIYTTYVHSHFCTSDPSQYLAQCIVAVKKRG